MTDQIVWPMTIEGVWDRRQKYWANGYRVFAVWNPGAHDHNDQPVKNAGKAAKGANWRIKAMETPPLWARTRPETSALNTGALGGELVPIDADCPDQGLVDQIIAMIEGTLGPTPLVRQGQPPKVAMLYRADPEFGVIKGKRWVLPGYDKLTQIEVMGRGGQIVIDGIHPVTEEPYQWLDQHPLDVPLSELPLVSERQAHAIIAQAEDLIIAAGGTVWVDPNVPPQPERPRPARTNGASDHYPGANGSGFFHDTNQMALKHLEDWVPSVFPHAKQNSNGSWRVRPDDRGQSKQELSLDPRGIKDFYLDRTFSPIDVVIAYGPDRTDDAEEAALWLCDRMHVDPARFGYGARNYSPPQQEPEPPGPDGLEIDGIFDGGSPTPPNGKAPNGSGGAPRPPERVILCLGGLRHVSAQEGLLALREQNLMEMYLRGTTLVRVVPARTINRAGIVVAHHTIADMPMTMVARALGMSARWLRYYKKSLQRIDPPAPIVEQISAMIEHWHFPPLAAVCGTPTLRPDGSLLQQPGYDAKSGIYLSLGDLHMPYVAEHPSKIEAQNALNDLKYLLSGFPFSDDASLSVALSLLITPVVRPAMPVAPLHLVSAPLPGTGKSYLIDIASVIATGEVAAVHAMAPREEETEKRLVGAALGGYPLIVLDNVRAVVQGDFLCQISERPLLRLRPLGTSAETEVPNSFVMAIDGNNLIVADDMVRRCIKCVLDANMADPEDREFLFDPVAKVRADRGHYLAACLTIVRGYQAAGRQVKLRPLPSYEKWSELVREALVWLGEADPLDSMRVLRIEDPGRAIRALIFECWASLILELEELARSDLAAAPFDPGRGFTTQELTRYANDDDHGELREALLPVAAGKSDKGAPRVDPTRLGHYLRKQINTIAGGRKLVVNRNDRTRPRWVLAYADQQDQPQEQS